MRMFLCALGSLSDRLYYLMIWAGFPILFTVPGLGKGTWRGQSRLSFTDKEGLVQTPRISHSRLKPLIRQAQVKPQDNG